MPARSPIHVLYREDEEMRAVKGNGSYKCIPDEGSAVKRIYSCDHITAISSTLRCA